MESQQQQFMLEEMDYYTNIDNMNYHQIQNNEYNENSNCEKINQYEQNTSKNVHLDDNREEINLDTIENNVETEKDEAQCSKNIDTTKLKYKDVQTLFQKQYKRLIQEQEIAKTSCFILSQENNSILFQINEEQRNVETLQLGNEKISKQIIQSNGEIAHIERAVLNAGEIDKQLKENVNWLNTTSKSVQESYREVYNKFSNQKDKFIKLINSKKVSLNTLRKNLDDLKLEIGDRNNLKINENSLVQQKLFEKREYMDQLAKNVENLNESYDSNEERAKLQIELDEKIEKNMKLNNNINALAIEKTGNIDNLNDHFQKIMQRIDTQEQNIIEENNKLKEYLVRKEELQNQIETNLQKNSNNEIKLLELKKDNTGNEKKITDLSEEFSTKMNHIMSDLDISEKKMYNLKEENNNKVKATSAFVSQCLQICEEKNNLIDKKAVLENESSAEKLALQSLEAKITILKKAEADLERISDNPLIIDLTKKKAFLIACTDFLSETNKNVRKQYTSQKSYTENATIKVDQLIKSIEIKKDEKNRLINRSNNSRKITHPKRENRMISASVSFESKQEATSSVMPSSILKKKPQVINTPISPKKVQFANLSSYESSVPSDPPAEEVPNFEKILENFRKSQSVQQKTPKTVKRGRFVFD